MGCSFSSPPQICSVAPLTNQGPSLDQFAATASCAAIFRVFEAKSASLRPVGNLTRGDSNRKFRKLQARILTNWAKCLLESALPADASLALRNSGVKLVNHTFKEVIVAACSL